MSRAVEALRQDRIAALEGALREEGLKPFPNAVEMSRMRHELSRLRAVQRQRQVA